MCSGIPMRGVSVDGAVAVCEGRGARATLDRPEWFDAEFFEFTPREAELTDPQHRVFLECAWTALEDAALDPARYAGSIGVWAGSSLNTYLLDNIGSHREQIAEFVTQFQAEGYPLLLGWSRSANKAAASPCEASRLTESSVPITKTERRSD